MPIIEGAMGAPQIISGAPGAGTDEVQTVTVTGTPTGGDFRLSYGMQVTGAIAIDANAAAVDAALEALSSIGAGGVTVGGGPLPGAAVTVTFTGNHGKRALKQLLVLANNSLTGGTNPTVTIEKTTAGVDASARGAAKGTLLIDADAGELYINTGTSVAPTFVKAGTQS